MITPWLYQPQLWTLALACIALCIIVVCFETVFDPDEKAVRIAYVIAILSIIVSFGYEFYSFNQYNQKPFYDNFTVVRMSGHLKIDSKNSHYQSVLLPIADETDQDYLVNYQGKVYTVPKNP